VDSKIIQKKKGAGSFLVLSGLDEIYYSKGYSDYYKQYSHPVALSETEDISFYGVSPDGTKTALKQIQSIQSRTWYGAARSRIIELETEPINEIKSVINHETKISKKTKKLNIIKTRNSQGPVNNSTNENSIPLRFKSIISASTEFIKMIVVDIIANINFKSSN
jgi:hypothetical protein